MPRRRTHPVQSAILVLLTAAIFAVDAFTRLDTAIAVMYVVVLLLASPVWPRRYTLALGAACVLLTMGAYAVAHGLRAARDRFVGWADDGQRRSLGILRIRRKQFAHPADVIAMMMCDYNGTERKPALLQEAQHRLRVARVDDSSHTAIV